MNEGSLETIKSIMLIIIIKLNVKERNNREKRTKQERKAR